MGDDIKCLARELDITRRELDLALDFLRRQGYRRCDTSECNCTSWHGGNANERLREIDDICGRVIEDVAHSLGCAADNETIIEAIGALQARLAEAERDAARYRWLRERDLDTIERGGVFAGQTPQNLVINGDDLDRAVDEAREGDNAGR